MLSLFMKQYSNQIIKKYQARKAAYDHLFSPSEIKLATFDKEYDTILVALI